MRVLFAYLTNNPYGEEHLGTASIASYLEKQNYEVILKLVIYKPNEYNIERIVDDLPQVDIIGFPIFTINARVIFELCKKIKEKFPQTLVTVGGPLATDAAREILEDCKDIDLVVLGDGEETYCELAEAIEKGKDYSSMEHVLVQNDKDASNKVPFITDIANKPWVSRQYLEQVISRGFMTARLTTARGCCSSCAFCSHNSYTRGTNKVWRGRDIEDVYKEIIYLYEKYGIQSFSINDGSFEDPGRVGKERVKKFCNLIINSGLKFHFWSFLRAETFNEADLQLVQAMRQAGFTTVFIGVESQNIDDLTFYHKRATPQDNIRALELFKNCGINVIYGFILFNPRSDKISLKENYKFLKSIECWRPHVFVSRLDIYYKTQMHKQCRELGVLTSDFNYLNSTAYRFIDDEVNEIWKFIEENLLDSIIFSKYDAIIFNFNNYLYSLLAFMPNEIDVFLEQFNLIAKRISNCLVEYFYNLYDEKNLEKAKKDIPIFESNMEKYVREVEDLKLKMLRRNLIKQFENRV